VSYIPQYVTVPIDPETTPAAEVLRIFKERAVGYARDIMEGREGPYATREECDSVCRLMVGGSQVRVTADSCKVIGRKSTVSEIASWSDGGWQEVPRHAVAELVRTGNLKRFQRERELDRVGWQEMGWDGDQADWYGWPA
jgi:hypothetical protein